jgi:hypothetical protein
MQGKRRLKPHYRAHILGDWNYDTGQPIKKSGKLVLSRFTGDG